MGIICSRRVWRWGSLIPPGDAEAIGLWNLAAGLAVYLVGHTLYRRVLHIGPGRLRLAIAALGFLTVPLGLAFGALAQVVACVLLLQPLWPSNAHGSNARPGVLPYRAMNTRRMSTRGGTTPAPGPAPAPR